MFEHQQETTSLKKKRIRLNSNKGFSGIAGTGDCRRAPNISYVTTVTAVGVIPFEASRIGTSLSFLQTNYIRPNMNA